MEVKGAAQGCRGQDGVTCSRGASLTLLTELGRREHLVSCLPHPNRPTLDEEHSRAWVWRERHRNSLLSPRFLHMSGNPDLKAAIEFSL